MSYKITALCGLIISIVGVFLPHQALATTRPAKQVSSPTFRKLVIANLSGCSVMLDTAETPPFLSEEKLADRLSEYKHFSALAAFGNEKALKRLQGLLAISVEPSQPTSTLDLSTIDTFSREVQRTVAAISSLLSIDENTPVIDPRFNLHTLQWIAARALLGNQKYKKVLENLATQSSEIQPEAIAIKEAWPVLLALLNTKTPLEFANSLNEWILHKYTEFIQQNNDETTDLSSLGQKAMAFMDGPRAVAWIIRYDLWEIVPGWNKNTSANRLMHDIANSTTYKLGLFADQWLKGKRTGQKTTSASAAAIPSPSILHLTLDLLRMMRPEPSKNDLFSIVLRALKTNEDFLGFKEIEIFINIPDGIIIRDKALQIPLQRILEELIRNVTKYCKEFDTLPPDIKRTLSIIFSPETRVLQIIDNGKGIKYTKKIWRKGYQETRHPRQKGGEGLWYVKRESNKYHLKIRVDSVVGLGSTFTLELPE